MDLQDLDGLIDIGVIYNGTSAAELGLLGIPCVLCGHFAPIDYPIGHRNRRGEGIPVLVKKFEDALAGHLPAQRVNAILALTQDPARFEATPVHRLMDLFSL
jgi:hypothetical protein